MNRQTETSLNPWCAGCGEHGMGLCSGYGGDERPDCWAAYNSPESDMAVLIGIGRETLPWGASEIDAARREEASGAMALTEARPVPSPVHRAEPDLADGSPVRSPGRPAAPGRILALDGICGQIAIEEPLADHGPPADDEPSGAGPQSPGLPHPAGPSFPAEAADDQRPPAAPVWPGSPPAPASRHFFPCVRGRCGHTL